VTAEGGGIDRLPAARSCASIRAFPPTEVEALWRSQQTCEKLVDCGYKFSLRWLRKMSESDLAIAEVRCTNGQKRVQSIRHPSSLGRPDVPCAYRRVLYYYPLQSCLKSTFGYSREGYGALICGISGQDGTYLAELLLRRFTP